MTATDQMRAMLDQLMGTARDGQEGAESRLRFDDPRVCKSFLLECCPHEILAATRMDLGDCAKVHDLALRADYQAESKNKDYFYDIDAMEHLSAFVADCDRRTEMAKKRLKETQEELSDELTAKAEAIHQLGEQIGIKLAHAEAIGGEGNVSESLSLMEEVEQLKKQKALEEIDYRNSMPASSYQQQKLRVCEVCSAYLGIHDNDRRLADHFGGKLHMGFIKIRQMLVNLEKSVDERRQLRDLQRELRRHERAEEDRAREAARVERRRDRSRSRDRKKRSRSRDRRRKRSRSRDRHRRKHHRSRSRDRRKSRSRSRKRKRRSRSRSRQRRSRSRSKRSKENGAAGSD